MQEENMHNPQDDLPPRNFKQFCPQDPAFLLTHIWDGSRGGSGGSVEPPKLNEKMYSKRVVKKKVNQLG